MSFLYELTFLSFDIMFDWNLLSLLLQGSLSSRLTAIGILIFIKIMTELLWEVNGGIIKGLNVEQCLFILLFSGEIRLGLEDSDGWSPARTTLGRGTIRWSEGSGESGSFAGALLFTSDSPCRNVSYVLLQPVLNQSCGKVEDFIIPNSLTDISMSCRY